MTQPGGRTLLCGGSVIVIKLSHIFRDYQESGALNALVNIHSAVDDATFFTKGGALIQMAKLRGADYDLLDAPQLEQITHRFESAIRIFDENFRIDQYLIKRDSAA